MSLNCGLFWKVVRDPITSEGVPEHEIIDLWFKPDGYHLREYLDAVQKTNDYKNDTDSQSCENRDTSDVQQQTDTSSVEETTDDDGQSRYLHHQK